MRERLRRLGGDPRTPAPRFGQSIGADRHHRRRGIRWRSQAVRRQILFAQAAQQGGDPQVGALAGKLQVADGDGNAALDAAADNVDAPHQALEAVQRGADTFQISADRALRLWQVSAQPLLPVSNRCSE